MSALDLIKKINKKNIYIEIADGNLHISDPDGAINQEILLELRAYKEELLVMLQSQIPQAKTKTHYPTTPAQQRFWVLSQFEGSKEAYNIPVFLELTGHLNIELLEETFKTVIKRHESLRTFFKENEAGEVFQYILPSEEIIFEIDVFEPSDIDTTTLDGQINEVVRKRWISNQTYTSFNLSTAPLLKVSLLKEADNKFYLSLVMHHIITDGWSMEVLTKEVSSIYNSLLNQDTIQLVDLPIQYKDYTEWFLNKLPEFKEQENFWLKTFSREIPTISLHTDYKRPVKKTFNGNNVKMLLSPQVTHLLKEVSEKQGLTLFTILMAGINGILYRYTKQNDIIIGIPSSGREHPDLENQMGLYVNTLAIRTSFPQNVTFRELLSLQKEKLFTAYNNQDYPFDYLVSQLNLQRDTSRSPIFDVMAVLQNQKDLDISSGLKMDGLNLNTLSDSKIGTSKFDLTFTFVEEKGLLLDIEYNTDLFKHSTIERLSLHLDNFLKEAITELDKNIEEIIYISKNEEQQLLKEFNNTTVDFPEDETIVSLFEQQVKVTPNKIAFVFNKRVSSEGYLKNQFEQQEISYKTLNERANQFANFLIKNHQIQEKELVGVLQEKSEWLLPVLLGILKVGAAYVPIDPTYPKERVQYFTDFTNCKIVVNNDLLSHFKEKHTSYSTEAPVINITPAHTAHIMFTSGSTGTPKGVMLSHKNVVGFAKPASYMDINKDTIILSTVSVSFDTTNMEFWSALLNQAKIILVKKQFLLSPTIFKHIITENIVNTMFLTNSWFENLIDADLTIFKGITQFLTGGDMESSKHFNLLKSSYPAIKIIHCYGPCEDTTFSTTFIVDKLYEGRIPIGKPVDNTCVYILNEHRALESIGIPGILYLGGIGVSQGYYKNDALNQERFIQSPFRNDEKLYNTGDYAIWNENGTITFIGRVDRQIKIRGKIIPTSEIEQALNSYEEIDQSLVDVRLIKNEKRIIAFIVAPEYLKLKSLKDALKKYLPYHMIPEVFKLVSDLPLNGNGKVNRKKLPEVTERDLIISDQYEAPKNAIQRVLVMIWEKEIKVDQIGINNNFFDIGGHSLLAVKMIAAVKEELRVELFIDDVFLHPTIKELSAYISTKEKKSGLATIQTENRPTHVPLSYSQERLWFIDKLEGSLNYHIPIVLKIRGALNFEALERSFKGVIQRHEVLRSVFYENEEGVFQKSKTVSSWALKKIKKSKQQIKQLVDQEIWSPFDLSSDYLLRATVIEERNQEFRLIIVGHHIGFDGWSMPIFVNELVNHYEAMVTGKEANIKDLPIQYADYAIWQKRNINGAVLDQGMSYWKEHLTSAPVLSLPLDFPRPAVQSYKGRSISYTLSKGLTNKINQLAHREGVTLYMTTLAAYYMLLYKYTGQQDICIGTPVANRDQKAIAPLIGFFLNTLPLRTCIDGKLSFKDFLSTVKNNVVKGISHQNVPFERIVQQVVKTRDMSRSALFQTMFILQNNTQIAFDDIEGIEITDIPFEQKTSKYDLTLSLEEATETLNIQATYNTGLFTHATILQLLKNYESLLTAIIDQLEEPIDKIIINTPSNEEDRTVAIFHSLPEIEAPSILTWFEQQVNQQALTKALVYNSTSLSYGELGEASKKVAISLTKMGIQKGDIIAIHLANPLETIIAILGTLKAGAVYLPIDHEFPHKRVEFIIEDSQAKWVFSDKQITLSVKNLLLSDILDKTNILEVNEKEIALYPNDSAYVIYTSGSTGKPKGVKLSHANLLDYFQGLFNRTAIADCQSFALMSTFASDLGKTVLYGSLLTGGTLHLFSKEQLINPNYIQQYFAEHKIDCIKITPSHWKAMEIETPLLPEQMLIFGGEALTGNEIRKINDAKVDITVFNHYGPTETTIGKLIYAVDLQKKYAQVPIGKVFTNTSVYILDKYLQPVPKGVLGELYIAGKGLAQGYLNESQNIKTPKFIANPFEEGTTLYKTGDLVRQLPNGDIEFIGRIDDQVKIRGNRVEMKEIEAVLLQSEMVKNALVTLSKSNQDLTFILAYIIPQKGYQKDILFVELKDKLPSYMVPSSIISINEFPLTPNGKIDKRKLPQPQRDETYEVTYVAPSTHTEIQLVSIWEKLFNYSGIGIYDNFFELGGHSLLAMKVISAIRISLNTKLEVRDIFLSPSIASLAAKIQISTKEETFAIQLPIRPERIPLSFSQERLWFLDKVAGSTNYHIPIAIRLHGELNVDVLEKAIIYIINRHETLRTVYKEKGGTPYQEILPKGLWNLKKSSIEDENQLPELIHKENLQHFDLSKDCMVRGHLIRISSQESVLSLILHHIAFDGWSRKIFINELEEVNLPPLVLQYADISIWERERFNKGVLKEKIEFWKEKLKNTTPLNLPFDYRRPEIQGTAGKTLQLKVEKALKEKLQIFCNQQEISLFILLESTLKVLLYRYTGQQDITIGTSLANRFHPDMEKTIGFFVNTLVLRSQVQPKLTFVDFLAQVKQTTLEAYEHQEVPFEKIVSEVSNRTNNGRTPLFDVGFTLQNHYSVNYQLNKELSFTLESLTNEGAKFDLNIGAAEMEQGLLIDFEYRTDLFKEETIKKMADQFAKLLELLIENPYQAIQENFISVTKNKFNTAQVASVELKPTSNNIIKTFQKGVLEHPEAIALVFKNKVMTYEELDIKSTKLAQLLINKGVQKQDMVPIFFDHSSELIVGLWGIMKAGAVYVPIDTFIPEVQLKYILEVTSAKYVVTEPKFDLLLSKVSNLVHIYANDEALEGIEAKMAKIDVTSTSIAYLLYNWEGSEQPKGTMVAHQTLIASLVSIQKAYPNTFTDRLLLKEDLMSAEATHELFGWVCSGASLEILPLKNRNEGLPSIVSFLKDTPVTHLHLSQSLCKGLFNYLENNVDQRDSLSKIQQLMVSTTGLDNELLSLYHKLPLKADLIFTYGHLETMMDFSHHKAGNNHKQSLYHVIGECFEDNYCTILDANMEPIPEGMVSNLYLGGTLLTQGYFNEKEHEADRFVQNPFSNTKDSMLFKTGNLARYTSTGEIQLVGRTDQKVKSGSYTIDFQELSQTVERIGSIEKAILFLEEKFGIGIQLIAYIKCSEDYDTEELNTLLSNTLPYYLVPTSYIQVTSFPLDDSGNIDRRILQKESKKHHTGSIHVAPATELETKLVKIWAEILGLDKTNVSTTDNFFDLGGRSLTIINIISKIREILNIELPFLTLFNYATIKSLANYIELSAEQEGSLEEEYDILDL
jgi:amino acid adenylation domain-containing protein